MGYLLDAVLEGIFKAVVGTRQPAGEATRGQVRSGVRWWLVKRE